MFLNRSLTARIVLGLSIVVVVGLGALVAVVTMQTEAALKRDARLSRSIQSRLLADQMSGGIKWRKTDSVERIFAPFTAEESESNLANVHVATADGEVLASYESALYPAADLAPVIADARSLVATAEFAEVLTPDHSIFVERIADPKSGEPIGVAIFAWSLAAMHEELAKVKEAAAITGLVVAGACLLTLLVLVQLTAARPLRVIRQSMARLAEGDTQLDIPYRRRRDEIGGMASAVGVFRDNAVRMTELDAEKAEAERLAAEEREAARDREASEAAEKARLVEAQQHEAQLREEERRAAEEEKRLMMDRLRDAFGDMVDGAIAGDFSRRIEVAFDDETLDRLADGLNTMANVVAAGLGESRNVLSALAHYNLSRRIEGEYSGAFEELTRDVNLTVDNLGRIISDLDSVAGVLRERVGALSTGFDDLSNRTTNQAASVEETSAALTLLNESVSQSAERADRALQRVAAARGAASESGEIMNTATDAMDRVARSSDEIAAIVEIIEGIAFQTNLLSLNASVEAARAGEAGAGFAVVAAEVRNLAQSTASSSAEIRTLIDRSRDEVAKGVDSVGAAATTLNSIIDSVAQVSELMGEISADAADQAGKLTEIDCAVRQVDNATQSNAQLVESATSILEDAVRHVEQIDRIAKSFVIAPTGTAGLGKARAA